MAENLPRLREEIKEISMSDLKDFLESIRKHSDKVGETAMRQVWEIVFKNVIVAVKSYISAHGFVCVVCPSRLSSTERLTVPLPSRPVWASTPSLCTPLMDEHTPTLTMASWWTTTQEMRMKQMKRWGNIGCSSICQKVILMKQSYSS